MEIAYSKDQCLAWIQNPEIDPVQKTPTAKHTFKTLRNRCQQLLTPEEVTQVNQELLPIIFPQHKKGFDVPSDIKYQIIPLNEDYEHVLNQEIFDSKWSKSRLLERLQDTEFIKQILQSEKTVLKKKVIAYEILPDHQGLAVIQKRLKVLNNLNDSVIKEKREDLTTFVEQIQTLVGTSRKFIKRILYQKIWYFSISPDLSTHQIIIGKHGTGRTKVAQLFASLYHTLGLINTDQLADQISQETLESTICLSFEDIPQLLDQFGILCGIVLMVEDQTILKQLSPLIRKEFPHTIVLSDYTGQDLGDLIKHNLSGTVELSDDNSQFLQQVIKNNRQFFTCQAKDITVLSQIIVHDYLLMTSDDAKAYERNCIINSLRKFFLYHGQYIRLDEQMKISLNPVGEITTRLKEILTANLMTRDQIVQWVNKDGFVQEVINAKKKFLAKRMEQYGELLEQRTDLPSPSLSQVRHELHDIIKLIETIRGDSRENIRCSLYSQIYLFAKLTNLDCFFNYIIISQQCSNDDELITVLTSICNRVGSFMGKYVVEPVDLPDLVDNILLFEHEKTAEHKDQLTFIEVHQSLCGVIMTKRRFTSVESFEHLFPNFLVLIPFTSDELYEKCLSQIDNKLLTPSQEKYIKQLIHSFNHNKDNGTLFDSQSCDMTNLARDLQDDILVYAAVDLPYGIDEINQTFQRFFQEKNLYINFSSGQKGGCGCDTSQEEHGTQSILTVFKDARSARLRFFN